MQSMEPQTVSQRDILSWIKQAFDLINRRLLAYLTLVLSFFLILFFSTQAMLSVDNAVPAVILLFGFLVFAAFIFYFSIAALVMISFWSDHSQHIPVTDMLHQFLKSQRGFFRMAFMGTAIGLFYWYASLLINTEQTVMTSSEEIIFLFSRDGSMIFYLLKTGAVFLYFVLLGMFTLRTFFSVPLILFHDLQYADAQALSQRAIIKNIKVMSTVLILWIVTFMLAMKLLPALAIVLLPLFAAFNYVAYRHIFLGQLSNEKVRARQNVASHSHV